MRHYYLQGIMATLTNQPGSAALFNFTKILEELDEGHQTIYSQLAYLGSGILYARRGKMDRADFFFAKVISYLHEGDSERARADQREYLRIIMMMYYVAEYHALSQQLATSLTSCPGSSCCRPETPLRPGQQLLRLTDCLTKQWCLPVSTRAALSRFKPRPCAATTIASLMMTSDRCSTKKGPVRERLVLLDYLLIR